MNTIHCEKINTQSKKTKPLSNKSSGICLSDTVKSINKVTGLLIDLGSERLSCPPPNSNRIDSSVMHYVSIRPLSAS